MSQTNAKVSAAKLSPRILLAFACVYLFWGSTYLAMRVGVHAMPPFVLGAGRFLISGPLMLAICAARGLKLRASAREFALMAAIGGVMLSGGNMGVLWSEQYLPSGLASLLVAAIPLWVALIEAILPQGERLEVRGWAGIALGFVGLAVLLWPGLRYAHMDWRAGGHAVSGQLLGAAVCLGASLLWSGASVLSRRSQLVTSAFVASGWEMCFAGVFNCIPLAATGQWRQARWSPEGALAMAWLVVFGSLVGYTAYIYLLHHVPVARVSTYAYVNPVVAVLLGVWLLHEHLGPVEISGMLLILLAVYLLTRSKLQSSRPAAEMECVEAEPVA